MSNRDLAKVQACLDLLQQAQSIVNCAAQALSSVDGFGHEWGKLSKPHDCIKEHWHLVRLRLSQQLAGQPNPYAPAAAQKGGGS